MQHRPGTSSLLLGIADLLENDVLAAVPAELQHCVRVAGNLVRLVEREFRLGPDADAAERSAVTALLAEAARLSDAAPATGQPILDDMALPGLVEMLAETIRAGALPAIETAAWAVAVEATRADLEIAKPGYTEWTST